MVAQMKLVRLLPLFAALACLVAVSSRAADPKWQMVPGKMTTRWAKDVSPKKAWPEYPRPQFERENWKNLNGL